MAVRKTTTALLDKSGTIIFKSEWQARRENEAYWLLHKTVSKSGHIVTAEWSGKIENAHRTPKSKWAPWALEVSFQSNTDENGKELAKPVITRDELACEQFVTLEELQTAYNAFITKYCGAEPVTLTKGADDPAPPVVEETSYEDEDDDGDGERDDDGDEDEERARDTPVRDEPIVVDEGADKVSGGGGGDW